MCFETKNARMISIAVTAIHKLSVYRAVSLVAFERAFNLHSQEFRTQNYEKFIRPSIYGWRTRPIEDSTEFGCFGHDFGHSR